MDARLQAGFRSALAASKHHGWAQKSYYNHERGTVNFGHLVHVYANAFNTTAETLLDGKESPPQVKVPPIHSTPIRRNSLPKMKGVSKKNVLDLFECSPLSFMLPNPDRALIPQLVPDDILVFDPIAQIRAGDFVLAEINGLAEPVIRIFAPQAGGGANYLALNPIIEPIRVTKRTDWKNVAKLRFFIRSASTLG
jgi:hypothetical protein